MDIGLLVLRLLVGGLVFGHGAQKAFGAFGGLGPAGSAPLFEQWGLRPGRRMVVTAAAVEITGSMLLILGLLTPLGAAMVVGTLTVAASVNRANGLWAVKGGYELPLLYAGSAAALAFTGPGRYALDSSLDLTGRYGVGVALGALVVALALAAGFIAYARHHRVRTVAA